MNASNKGGATMTQSKEFSISRTFDAPRELVWKALTEPERLMQWWSPKGFGRGKMTVDLRPGGLFHYLLATPKGEEFWGRFVYQEIVPPEKLVYIVSFSDAEGGVTRHLFSDTWPLETLNTMTLIEEDGKTTISVTAVAYKATDVERQTFEDGFGSMKAGFTGTFDQLKTFLAQADE